MTKIFLKISTVIAFLILAFMWIYTIVNYQNLPDKIPVHFGLNGQPDSFGGKKSVWLLPIIATFNFFLLYFVSKDTSSPLLNLPENIKKDPALSGFIVNILQLTIAVLFAVITVESIQVSVGKSAGLSYLTEIIVALLLFLVAGIYLYSWKLRKIEKKF